MSKILITGATGFIGGHLAAYYLEHGYEVISILHDEAPLTTSKLIKIHSKVTWCKGDILDLEFVKRIVAAYEVDEVIHCAALPIVRVGTRTTTPIFSVNVMGAVNLLESVKEQHLSGYPIKYLYLGTDKEYGYAPLNKPYTEETPLMGLNVYDASKAMADIACQCYYHSFGIPLSVVRACNIFGPADLNSRIIPNSLKFALTGKPPIIFRGIAYVREFLFVDDLCEAIKLVLDRIDETKGNAYNVGSGVFLTQEECINEILSFFPGLKAVHREPPKYTRIEIPYQRLDSSKIRKELGWQAKTSFRDGLKKTVDWYRENMHILTATTMRRESQVEAGV